MPLRDLPMDGRGPVYEQIYRAVREAILAGRAAAGLRLPSSRALAEDLSVSRTTVLAAYEQLLAEGYVIGRRGSGTYVAPQLPAARSVPPPAVPAEGGSAPSLVGLSRWGRWIEQQAPARDSDRLRALEPVRFDFRPCLPELEELPSQGWRRAATRRAAHPRAAGLDYGDPAGQLELRRELAAYLARARGVSCAPGQIVVVSGVTQALDLAARLFVDPGDTLLIEEPHYPSARQSFEAAGARLLPARLDAEGLVLPRSTGRARVKLAYVTPSHQFPTGVVLSLPRRLALLEWASRTGAYVLEDDYDSEFRYGGRAIEALKSLDRQGRVLYVGTFSKTLFPALRSAYMVLPEPLVEVFRSARWVTDAAPPVLEQEALTEFLGSGSFERHLRRARTLYGQRRRTLLAALRDQLGETVSFQDSRAGLHVLVRIEALPAHRLPRLLQAAREREVRVYRADPCYLAPPERAELLLGFTRLSEAEIEQGVARLAGALAALGLPGRAPAARRAASA